MRGMDDMNAWWDENWWDGMSWMDEICMDEMNGWNEWIDEMNGWDEWMKWIDGWDEWTKWMDEMNGWDELVRTCGGWVKNCQLPILKPDSTSPSCFATVFAASIKCPSNWRLTKNTQ